jgi:hypothetical protein
MTRRDMIDDTWIRELSGRIGAPVGTITVPTHRCGPEVGQEQVILRQLLQHMPDGEVVERLRAEISTIDFQQARDGLVVYASADWAEHVVLDVSVPPRSVLSDRPLVEPVVRALQQQRSAWLISISELGARLWQHRHGQLHEVLYGGFPLEVMADERHQQALRSFGRQRSVLRDERRRDVVRQVDKALSQLVAAANAPVFVAAAPHLWAMWRDLTSLSEMVVPERLGGLDRPDSRQLQTLANFIDDRLRDDHHRHILGALDRARGLHRLATDLDEIATLAADGAAAQLVLDESCSNGTDESFSGRIDQLIADVITHRGEVTFVAQGVLADQGRHALITRF